MLNKSNKNLLVKATIKNLMVAFIYTAVFLSLIFVLFHKEIKNVATTINLISIKTSNKILEDIKFDFNNKTLTSYPEYGTKYANLEIPSLDIDLPVFYGDTLAILKNGIGHSSGSYFPGEGGRILYMGHNNAGILRRLSEIKNNAYERLLDKPEHIEIIGEINKKEYKIREYIKNPIIIKINNDNILKEKDLQIKILAELKTFFEELGEGYTFVGNEYKIKYGSKDYYIDILLFNYNLILLLAMNIKLNMLVKIIILIFYYLTII